MPQDNIVDASKPSAGRMYDYFLGGHHNFEVDRQAAEQALKLMPFGARFVRLQRWALQDIAQELSAVRGFDTIIDFASGLPTQDNIHSRVAQGTTVIYSDTDPVVVEYAREILGNTKNVYYFTADATKPEELLTRPEVQKILGGRRKVAFVTWGLGGFISDDDISHAAKALYDWCEPGSCWAFNCQAAGANAKDLGWIAVSQIYEKMGSPLYLRDLKKYEELLQPWKADKNGFISLLDWHGFDKSEMAHEGSESFGPMGGGYGVYLVK